MKTVMQRRICWPTPDLTCLEGGCGYCNNHRFRDVNSIFRAVKQGKIIPRNRGNGTEGDALESFRYGELHGWNNADSREVTR